MPAASASSFTHGSCLWFPRRPHLPAPSFPSQPERLRVWIALPASMTPHPPQPAPTHPSAVTVLPKATRPPWFISVLASPRPRAVVPSPDSPPQLAGSRRASHLSGCFISTPWLASPPPSVLSLMCVCLSGHCPGCLFFQTTPSPYGISYPPEAPLTQQSNHRISTHTCPCHSVPGRSWLHPSIPWPLPTFLNNSLY